MLVLGVFAVLLSVWITRAYWGTGFPYTHDGENHLARFVATAVAIRDGQWPPRFGTTLQNGYGFPALHYNYPLSNILAVPFIWLGLHPFFVYSLLVFFYSTVGVISTWMLLRRWWGKSSSLVGILTYATVSPLTAAIMYRGNVGEIAAFGLFPVVAWSWTVWSQRQSVRFSVIRVLSLMMFLLAHNLMAVMLSPFLLVWSVWQSWQRQMWREVLIVWLLACGLVAWFWIPAVGELSLVVLQGENLAREALQHFLSWAQLWWEPFKFGFSQPGIVDSLSGGMGGAALVWIGLAAAGLAYSVFSRATRTRVAFALGVSSIGIFLTLPISFIVWQSVPILLLFQFPWRFMWLIALSLPVLAAAVASVWPRRWWWVLLILLVWQWQWVQGVRPADRFTRDRAYYYQFPLSTNTGDENRPKTFLPFALPSYEPRPQVATGSGTVESIQKWKGSRHRYTIRVESDSVVVEPIVFFPGWVTKVDGKKVEQVFLEETRGFVAYRLTARPEQPYEVLTVFGERTPIRAAAEIVSLLSVGLLGSWLVVSEWKTWRSTRFSQEEYSTTGPRQAKDHV